MLREYTGSAPTAALASGINSSATSIQLEDGTGYPTGSAGPFFIVIDPGTASEEKVLIATRTDTLLAVATTGRGADDTAAVSHDPGAVVQHCFTATDAAEANAHVNATTGVHGVTGDLLGRTDTQVVQNKTISGLNNTFASIPRSAVVDLESILSDVQTDVANLETDVTTIGNDLNTEEAARVSGDAASSAALAAHEADTSTHGVGTVAGLTESQTLTNKTMSGADNTFSAIPVQAIAGANRQITFGEGSAVNITTGGGGSVGGFFDIPIGAQASATGLASGDITISGNVITINRGGLYAIMARIDSDSVAESDVDFGLVIPGLFDAPGVPIAKVGTTLRSSRGGGMIALVPLAATQTLYIQGAASGDTVNAVLRWLRFQQIYDI